METPSSTRRVTRSQTLSAVANNSSSISTLRKLGEESEKAITKSRQRTVNQQDRSALFDITNDSPIVGLAMGKLETPSSAMSKKRACSRAKQESTPGTGEALLRGQVKNLLQKVEEEAEVSKLCLEHGPFLPLRGLVNSPMGLIAPTPANTPHVLTLSAQINELGSPAQSPVEDKFVVSQMISEIFDGEKQEKYSECDKSLIVTRSLLLDFSEKSEGSCSSAVTYQGTESECQEKAATAEDDDASIWSIQVNASTRDEQEEDDDYEQGLEEVVEEECNDDDFYYEEDEADSELVDELCEAISKINVGAEKPVVKFTGKHTRFCYNSDDEIEGEEEVCSSEKTESVSSNSFSDALRLKGLPTPKGKHLRFPEEMDGN